ncbi:hypothetical protein V1264_015701 [Littorina saxatilis]|uniref:Uncharacterized protein n=1 Tax=Littorina saxatilis TaxID=31220 RepID=A0AAN9BMR3_9CAEN
MLRPAQVYPRPGSLASPIKEHELLLLFFFVPGLKLPRTLVFFARVEFYVYDRFLPRHLGSHTPFSEEACWVFSCFYNPPNSDMDYRIFFVRTWSCACVYTRGCSDTKESLHTKLTLRNKSLAERGDELTLTAANWIQIQRATD